MKRACLKCQRIFTDGNLFCQEHNCPGEQSPLILDKGQLLDEIEIVKPLIVLRTCVLYEAIHSKEPVLLKLAHAGEPHTSRLIDEGNFLASLTANERVYYHLPQLRSPYGLSPVRQIPIAQTVYQGNLLHYCVYQYFEGEPLPHLIVKNPQLSISQVSWLIQELAQSLKFLHSRSRLHLMLNPSSILVRLDKAYPHVPRILLFDLGAIFNINEKAQPSIFESIAVPAYMSPELLEGSPSEIADDVYALGTIFHELLNGYATIEHSIRDDQPIIEDVTTRHFAPTTRQDIDAQIIQLAEQALAPRNLRLGIDDFIKILQTTVGKIPKEKKGRLISQETIYLLIWTILSIAFLLAVALTLLPEPRL